MKTLMPAIYMNSGKLEPGDFNYNYSEPQNFETILLTSTTMRKYKQRVVTPSKSLSENLSITAPINSGVTISVELAPSMKMTPRMMEQHCFLA